MTESADLLAAIAAAPADDLPRLVFADWLDDRGEPAYAQFIRDQIRLAQVPQWDPLAVRARHQLKDSLGIGRPFFGALPELPIFLKWHPEKAFRRGFGSGVVVHQLSGLLEAGPQLFDLAPVEELWLSAATLDEWRQLAKSPWLKYVRKLHFHFSQGLHEPIRCLAESKYAYNIDEIWFDTLETPAAGLVIEALGESPLAKQLTGLHMRLVHTQSLLEVIAALGAVKFDKLEHFSMVQAGLDYFSLREIVEQMSLQSIRKFNIGHNSINYMPSTPRPLLDALGSIEDICFNNCGFSTDFFYELPQSDWILRISRMNNLRINLTSGPWFQDYVDALNRALNLQCLELSFVNIYVKDQVSIIQSVAYSRLIEFNMTGCELSKSAIDSLIKSPIPKKLESIALSKSHIRLQDHSRLESHFGDRLVWAADDAPTGLAR